MTSLSTSLICKILTVILLFCLAKASGGTCLSYGHSCWGGHGKRNNIPQWIGGNAQKRTGSWFISKLFNPAAVEKPPEVEDFDNFQNQNDDDYDGFEKAQKYKYQVYPVLDVTDMYSRNKIKTSDGDIKSQNREIGVKNFDEDIVFLAPDNRQRRPISKYRILQIMDQANGKTKLEN